MAAINTKWYSHNKTWIASLWVIILCTFHVIKYFHKKVSEENIPSNKKEELTSFEKDIHVSRVQVNPLQKPIYDIKPIKEIAFTYNDYFNKYRWVLMVLAAILSIGIVIFIIYWFLKKRPFSKKELVLVPPGEEAKNALLKLQEEEAWEENPKEYYSKLTDILRHYFERKLNFDAPESTSDEILQELKPELDDKKYEQLKQLLSDADLVKFAKLAPDASKHQMYLEESLGLVNLLEEKIANEDEEEDFLEKPIEVHATYFEFFGNYSKQDPQGTFALWWKTNSEDQFLDSVSKKVWDQFYHNYMVYHAYILGVLFNEKGIVDSKKEVYLPDEEEIYSFENKTLGTFIMIMSKEKGIMILVNYKNYTAKIMSVKAMGFICISFY